MKRRRLKDLSRPDRGIVIAGEDDVAGVITDRSRPPAIHHTTGILVGLPGGDPYLRRVVELGLIAEHRLESVARVRSFRFRGFVRHVDALRYGFPPPRRDVDRAREELRRERARASGLHVPDAPAKRPRRARRLILPGDPE